MTNSTPRTRPFHPAFIAVLEEEREQINQRFKLTSLEGAPLDGAAFKQHLADRIEPIVAAVHDHLPERVRMVTLGLVNISLELFRAGYWGNESRLPALDQLWEQLLPGLARFIAREPDRIVGSLTNALVNLSEHSPSTAHAWLEKMLATAEQYGNSQQLLDAGRVLAWLCGKADLRDQALALLPNLPRELVVGWLGLAASHDQSIEDHAWQSLLDRLARDRWAKPRFDRLADGSAAASAPAPAIMQRVGEFAGFGGQFATPPLVYLEDGQLCASDGRNAWTILADRFGHVMRRVVRQAETTGSKGSAKRKTGRASSAEPRTPHIAKDGRLQWSNSKLHWPHLAEPTSQAFDGQTLAVTIATSFKVYLIATE